jgi:uncharacterized secreted protein with C-terminal beta-propeller domain
MARRLLYLAVLIAAVAAAAPVPAAEAKPRGKQKLHAFQSCTGLVHYARRNALRIIRQVPVFEGGRDEGGAGGGQGEAQRDAPAVGGGDEDFSRTNVQEAGVDEADDVKTDGKTIFVATDGRLSAVDARAATPRLLDSLDLPAAGFRHELLLHGARLLVISEGGDGERFPLGSTTLTEVDATDPAALRVVRTMTVDGGYLSARLTGTTARVVLSSSPRVGLAVQTMAGAERAVRRARLARWVPRRVLRERGTTTRRPLLRCGAVRRPAQFSGLDLITVLTIDMARGLPEVDADALMTDGDTVYASPTSLYVASQRWTDTIAAPGEPSSNVRTAIHRFDASVPGRTAYRASGEVHGYLLSQWALSEHEGVLRAASTTAPPWLGEEEEESQSLVTVLEDRAGRLAEIGRLGGLGRGEQIYAVRFIGDTGFVVTFRQIDPLFTIDLSTPSAPKVLGELKIPGFSAYLHPVAEDLLLGVGQDATPEGRLRGTQLSLFDISDLSAPRQLHKLTIGGGSSVAEWDHRGFLYWPPSSLAVIGVQLWGDIDDSEPGFGGAIGFRVDRTAGIVEAGRITHPSAGEDSFPDVIHRSVVIGDRLFTVSRNGVQANSLATLTPQTWVPFE